MTSPRLERRLLRQGTAPIGSRRRRAALQDSASIPFEQLPYQCFQEARKVLLADREEKLKEIETMRQRLARQESLSVGGRRREGEEVSCHGDAITLGTPQDPGRH